MFFCWRALLFTFSQCLLHLTVFDAVGEVDHQTERQPAKDDDLGQGREAPDQIQRADDTEDRDERDQRGFEGPVQVGVTGGAESIRQRTRLQMPAVYPC